MTYAALSLGVLGVLFGARCYMELWRWARQCQNARIVVAHKNRVMLDAPLTDWLTWVNQLDKDEATTGRKVYAHAHASVSIVRVGVDRPLRTAIRHVRNTRKRRKAG